MEFFVHILLFQHQTAVGIDDAVRFGGRQLRPGRCRARCKHRQDGQKRRTQHGDVFFHGTLFICTPAALLTCRPGLPQAVHSKDIRAVSADSTRSDTLSVLKMQTAV